MNHGPGASWESRGPQCNRRVRVRLLAASLLTLMPVLFLCCRQAPREPEGAAAMPYALLPEQSPGWSDDDRRFFLHGSLGTEVVPDGVLRAWTEVYPDLFPTVMLTNFGCVAESSEWPPLGFSRRPVAHLGGLPSIGINCASCHAGQIVPPGGGPALTVLGTSAPFDAEAFLGSVVVALEKTRDPNNMKRFLLAWSHTRRWGTLDEPLRGIFSPMHEAIEREGDAIVAAVTEDPLANRGAGPGEFHVLSAGDLEVFRADSGQRVPLPALARNLLRLFHNMRAALHIPDVLPEKFPPPSGPGRNDAFGLLSATLFGVPTEYAPVKFGILFNVDKRRWVHWDGNTPSPMNRNLLAAVVLGAPLLGKKAQLDANLLRRHTDLSETIRPPRYPWAVDAAAAQRGAAQYQARCAQCHDGPETDARLHAAAETGTDPVRARNFTQAQADRFNRFLGGVQIAGFDPSKEPLIRSTQKYWASDLAGVWARGPFLHNGSVRTVADLLTPPAGRPKSFRRGGREYDAAALGFADAGPYTVDGSTPGNSNAGHDYGTDLSPESRRDLIEYLKTR